jgi:hypothetical protein
LCSDSDYHELRLIDVLALHEGMKSYDEWVENAPEAYKDDGFLGAHVPIAVSSRYGQNQPLYEDDEPTRTWWRTHRKMENIKSVCFAIATDIG